MALDLTCKELVEIVTDYIEDTLPPDERDRFETHLGTCDGCRTYLEQMRETIRLTGMLREEEISPLARDELLEVFRGWKQVGRLPSGD